MNSLFIRPHNPMRESQAIPPFTDKLGQSREVHQHALGYTDDTQQSQNLNLGSLTPRPNTLNSQCLFPLSGKKGNEAECGSTSECTRWVLPPPCIIYSEAQPMWQCYDPCVSRA